MKDIKGKRGREKIGEKKGEGKKRRKKGPNVGIEPMTSYSAAHVTTIEAVKNARTIYLSQISIFMTLLWLGSTRQLLFLCHRRAVREVNN